MYLFEVEFINDLTGEVVTRNITIEAQFCQFEGKAYADANAFISAVSEAFNQKAADESLWSVRLISK